MYIHVRVKPSSKEEKVTKKSETHYIISVKEPAERNLANKRIVEIISEIFSTKNVRIVNGHNSPSKLLIVGDSSAH
jgi:uncharacterized protein (TIGR00251 family)